MTTRLTKKQEGFIKDFIATDNATQAALNNYDTDDYNTASVIGSENLDKPKIKKTIAEMLPDSLLHEKHLALLNKTDKEGDIDTNAVRAGLDMAYKIKGTYAAEKKDVNLNGKISAITEEQRDLAAQYEKQLKQKI